MAEYDPSLSLARDSSAEEDDTNDDREVAQESGDDEDDDYDPSTFGFNPGPAPYETSSTSDSVPMDGAVQSSQQPAVAQQPRTVGGFIVEDDEEDDEEEQDDSAAPTPLRASSTAQDISLASAPTTDNVASVHTSSSTSLIRPTTVPDLENAASRPSSVTNNISERGKVEAPSIATPVPQTNGNAVPPNAPLLESARLPHDKVGRLEDRIKDDPKAATDAWRELLDYYKEKDQQENIRKTYERYLETFPTSVSYTPYMIIIISVRYTD